MTHPVSKQHAESQETEAFATSLKAEILCALCLLAGKPKPSANPHLTPLLREMSAHRIGKKLIERFVHLSKSYEEKELFRAVLSFDCGNQSSNLELAEFHALLAEGQLEPENVFGSQEYYELKSQIDALLQSTSGLVALIDAGEAVSQLCGEHMDCRFEVLPSLFLPAPPEGRIGVMSATPIGKLVGRLHFGFPLQHDAEAFGIDPLFVELHCRHLVLEAYLNRHWPNISRTLRTDADLENEVRLLCDTTGYSKFWPNIIYVHLFTALKIHMGGYDEDVGILSYKIGKERGLNILPWFVRWIGQSREANDGVLPLDLLYGALIADKENWKTDAEIIASLSSAP
ncbi:MAG: hypothetical protein AAGA53_00395 [Pseudomonadota bacterium]